MARKNKKLLSTLRALEDKHEPTSNQRELEEKPVPAPLNLAAASEREPQESEVASHVIAPLLTSSLLEEQLSEVVAVSIATAESLHITDITTPTETEAPLEVEAPTTAPTEAAQESLAPSQNGAIAEFKPEPKPEAEPQSETAPTQPASVASEEFSVPELDSPETTIPSEPVTASQTTPQAAPQNTQAVADPIASQPSHNSQTAAEQPENSDQQAEARNFAIATTSKNASQAELLKRPEAFALVVFAAFSSLWQAYVGWIKPTPHRQRVSQRSTHHSTVEPK